jgi:hypothetical protein
MTIAIRSAFAFGAAFLLAPAGSADYAHSVPATPEVEIVGHDYAFVAPTQLPAGQTTFRFTNKGKVIHELDVALLKDGTTSDAVMAALNTRRPLKTLIETAVGILIARPGHRSTAGLSTQLLEGRNYLLICRFQDSASAPAHSRMGMIALIHVAPSKSARVRVARTDTIIGMEYAFKAPRMLTPGRHTLTFVNAGRVLHEVNVALLRPGVTMSQAYAAIKQDKDDDRVVEEWLGVLFANAGAATTGHLQVNLLPNRDYLISCGLVNDDSAPPHFTLGMIGRMRTSRVTPSGR